MLFYSSEASRNGNRSSLATVRILTAVALSGYPAGALILALGPDGRGGLMAFELAGLALILVSLAAAAPVVGSSFQRIVGEQPAKLDEYELHWRHRATSAAYAIFTALALVAVIYCAIAADKGWWLPRTYDAFNGLFWGVFLYASLLPTACLTWSRDAASDLQ